MATDRTLEVSLPAPAVGHETQLKRAVPIAPPAPPPQPSYYDIPLLKRPVWSWEVGLYFFLSGLSAGSYLLARVAERVGGRRYRRLTRAGTAIAVAAAVPCAPLLIADLGDPRRFHHMLRVFKPRSPMNLGTWTLTAFSGVLFLTAVREWLRRDEAPAPPLGLRRLGPALFAVVDAAGVPLALLFSGYTGVLLSATATPVWSCNSWLGALFSASAISNGVSAISLALEDGDPEAEPATHALEKIDTVAHAAEGVALAGYLTAAGNLARPLTHGKWAPCFWGAVAGVVAGEVLKQVPARPRAKRWLRIAGAVAGLAGGLALKWAMLHAGPESAGDPDADRQVTRRRTPAGDGRLSLPR
jgi:formate-dependent nitrite reductase membrane component NrfD